MKFVYLVIGAVAAKNPFLSDRETASSALTSHPRQKRAICIFSCELQDSVETLRECSPVGPLRTVHAWERYKDGQERYEAHVVPEEEVDELERCIDRCEEQDEKNDRPGWMQTGFGQKFLNLRYTGRYIGSLALTKNTT